MVQINDDNYEDLTEESMGAILDALARGETPKPGPQVDRQTSCPMAARPRSRRWPSAITIIARSGRRLPAPGRARNDAVHRSLQLLALAVEYRASSQLAAERCLQSAISVLRRATHRSAYPSPRRTIGSSALFPARVSGYDRPHRRGHYSASSLIRLVLRMIKFAIVIAIIVGVR